MENKDQNRDEVLIAFHEECEIPTRADVERWADRHPRFARDIREHAAIRIALFAEADEASAVVDDVMHARSRSRLLDAMYNARRVDDAAGKAAVTFDQLASQASLSQTELVKLLPVPIKRTVVAALFAGRMLNPMQRFRGAIENALQISSEQFGLAYQSAISKPRLAGHAKARGQPGANQQEYEDIIRGSGMDEQQIRYWLEQD
jgi:hypothetical protein